MLMSEGRDQNLRKVFKVERDSVEQINEDDFRLGQIPAIQGAFVAVDPNNGSIEALVGGFDFK